MDAAREIGGIAMDDIEQGIALFDSLRGIHHGIFGRCTDDINMFIGMKWLLMGAIDNRTPTDRIGDESVELSRCRDFPSIVKCCAHRLRARISEKTPGRDLRHI